MPRLSGYRSIPPDLAEQKLEQLDAGFRQDGVRAEFELAKARGRYVIPVGSSGYMAAELWAEVMAETDKYFPKDTKKIKPLLQALGGTLSNPTSCLNLYSN